jgi:hypothetical protein
MCDEQCGAILKTGPNKGKQCGNYSTKGKGLCGIHQRSARKNKVAPLPTMYVIIGPGEVAHFDFAQDEESSEKKGIRRWMCM